MKLLKALVPALAALAFLIGGNTFAYAAASSSSTAETSAITITAAEASEAAADATAASEAATAEAATNPDGTINDAPNTGIAFPPLAAVFLALACVPVILLTGRRAHSS